ncbi:MAG: transcriptional repressor [Gemmatimonadetes bacterium]|nr:transcriptional repressor [Gemmatimonadota bacterium]
MPVTHQREAIAAAVFFSDAHLSVGDIERLLRERGVKAGKATVYRTLGLLAKAGLVQEHDFGEGFKRYEPLEARTHHEHLICLDCGKVVEFSNERIERMKALIADEHGFRHHHHRLEIYGICRECQRRDAVTLGTSGIQSEGSGR